MMRRILLRWLINALALAAAVEVIGGIHADGGWPVIIGVAAIFGLVNALIRPLITLLTCPLIVLTLGLFTLVINALMLILASWLGRLFGLGFYVDGFWAAFWGSLVVSAVSIALTLLIGEEKD